ncbi:MAG: sensor histidine kinase [Syntrophobacteraceae bacterium]
MVKDKGSALSYAEDPPSGMLTRCLEALFEKDRNSYVGSLLQGLIHNINGPLQNISMLVEMLERGQDNMDRMARADGASIPRADWSAVSEKQTKRFQQLSQQVVILTEMLRDFMILQEIERNGAEVDLNLALGRLVRVFRADLFCKHHVAVDLQIQGSLPMIRIPGKRLVPALIYIFKNSIDAVRESETKRLVIEGVKEDGLVRLVFRDSGCGFDDEEREKLFALFHSSWPDNVAASAKSEKHFGFGLYAVRELLAPYGVKVEIRRDGEETLVVLEIPCPS